MKIQITRNDVKQMVNEVINRLLNEDRNYTQYASLSVCPADFISELGLPEEEEEALYEKLDELNIDEIDVRASRDAYEESQTYDYPGYFGTENFEVDMDDLNKALEPIKALNPALAEKVVDYVDNEENWEDCWEDDEPDPDDDYDRWRDWDD